MKVDRRRQKKIHGCRHEDRRHMSFISIYLLLSSLIFLSCNSEDAIYREYQCYFIFDTQLHPQPCQLTGILGNPGHFCKIEASLEKGVRHLKTTRNYDGNFEDILLSTDRENQQRCVLGANNCIFFGTSSYDNILIAYEGQCSNCLNQYGGTRYPLTWQNNGQQLHCAKCGRTYDVNNGVVISEEGGKQLYRYQAAFDGQMIRAWN